LHQRLGISYVECLPNLTFSTVEQNTPITTPPTINTLFHITNQQVFVGSASCVPHRIDQQWPQILPLPFRCILKLIEKKMTKPVTRLLPNERGVTRPVSTDTAQKSLGITNKLRVIVTP